MAAELLLPTARASDTANAPYSGAQWFFYITGTSTPLAVYADADLATSLGAVVTADSAGKFPAIYFDASKTYRGVCKNSTGSVTLHDIDPLNTGFLATLTPELDKRPVFDVRGIIGGDGEIGPTLVSLASSGGQAWIAPGAYTIAADTEIGDLKITAHPEAVITQTGTVTATGTFTQIADLAGDVSEGGLTITFAGAHGLSDGDWFILYNPTDYSWHGARTSYRDGNWCQVRTVTSTTVVQITKPLPDGYPAAAIEVYKVDLKRPTIRGGRWMHGAVDAFHFTACTGQLTENVITRGASVQGCYIDRCVSFFAHATDSHNDGNGGGSDYAYVVGNSAYGRITGGRYYGRRHGIAMGGEDLLCSVPNRDVLVIGVGSIENDPTTGLVAADLHGNCDRCGYEGCTIYNGGAIGGRHPIYHLSRLIAASNGALLMLDEFRGGVVDLRNIQMRFDGTNVTFGDGLIDIGNHQAYFNEDTIETVHVLLDDYVLEAPNLAHDEALVRMANNGSDVAFNIRILRGKHITAGHRLRVLVSEVVSGTAASDGIIIDDISPALPSGSFSHLASGSAYASFPHHLPKQNITIDAATTAAEVIIPSAVTFPIGYPRAPHVVLGAPSSQNGSAFNSSLGTASGAAAVPFIYSVSSTDVRAGIRSGDGTAFANAQTFRLSLSVELREV